MHVVSGGHLNKARRHLLLPTLHAVNDRVGWISSTAILTPTSARSRSLRVMGVRTLVETGRTSGTDFRSSRCSIFERAYVNGNNKAACDTGNGATSCLIGVFTDFVTTGTVGPSIGGGSQEGGVTGVQLIR